MSGTSSKLTPELEKILSEELDMMLSEAHQKKKSTPLPELFKEVQGKILKAEQVLKSMMYNDPISEQASLKKVNEWWKSVQGTYGPGKLDFKGLEKLYKNQVDWDGGKGILVPPNWSHQAIEPNWIIPTNHHWFRKILVFKENYSSNPQLRIQSDCHKCMQVVMVRLPASPIIQPNISGSKIIEYVNIGVKELERAICLASI